MFKKQFDRNYIYEKWCSVIYPKQLKRNKIAELRLKEKQKKNEITVDSERKNSSESSDSV